MRTLLLAAIAALVWPLATFAQDGSGSAAETPQAAAERRTEQALRGMRTLGLTDDQTAKIRALVLEGELANEKQRAERTAQVEGLLNDDQKTKYRELVAQRGERRQGGGAERAPGERGGRGRGMGGRGQGEGGRGGIAAAMLRRYGLAVDTLAEGVGASAEQKEKITAAITAWQAGLRQAIQGADRDQIREVMKAQLATVRESIAALLDDTQKAKFTAMNADVDARLAEGGGTRPARGDGEGEGGRAAVDPEVVVKRRLSEAMTALALSADEAAVMSPLVEKLVRHNVTTTRLLREQREEIAKLAGAADADAAALEGKVATLALAQSQANDVRDKLQQGLRELLTRTQEFRLVGLGLLSPAGAPTTEKPAEGGGDTPAEK